MAFDPATLDRWRALAIVDRDGTTVGTISEFYLDRETGYPTWALVNTGLFGATQTFVPLVHATEIGDGLQVPYEKSHIKDTPLVDLHDELSPDEEAALFAHYSVDYQPSDQVAPPGEGPEGGSEPGQAPAGSEPLEGPGAIPTEPGSAEGPGPVPAEPGSVEGPGPVPAEPGSVEEPGPVPAEPGSAEGPVEPAAAGSTDLDSGPFAESGARYSSGPHEATGEVPDEPGTAEPDDATLVAPGGPGPASHLEERPADAPGDARPDPGADPSQVSAADPDLSRTAPVEPGLPGSTAASPGPVPTTVDKGDGGDPAGRPTDAGWPPGFDDNAPTDPPTGASDRWREAKLAAEQNRIARAAAAQPEERSPLERARRRLERLVGVGQEHPDPDDISPADREAAERARRARLGFEDDDPRRR
jgi:PRC-barrel domain